MIPIPIKPIVNKKKSIASLQDAVDQYYTRSSSNTSYFKRADNSEKNLNNNTDDRDSSFDVMEDISKDDPSTKQLVPKSARDKSESQLTSKLREAVIWSEILGKPMCKRRKRR